MADLISSVSKIWAAKKLFNFLSKDFSDLAIYKVGIIDDKGRLLVKTKDMTPQQRRMFSPFEKLMLLVKRTLKRHGVASLALAVTFLEDQSYKEFWIYMDRLVEDEELVQLLKDCDDQELIEEDGEPTTVSSNIAGTEVPLGMVRRKKQ
jgi:hypothetical protein